jgi:hypothetical protein
VARLLQVFDKGFSEEQTAAFAVVPIDFQTLLFAAVDCL